MTGAIVNEYTLVKIEQSDVSKNIRSGVAEGEGEGEGEQVEKHRASLAYLPTPKLPINPTVREAMCLSIG